MLVREYLGSHGILPPIDKHLYRRPVYQDFEFHSPGHKVIYGHTLYAIGKFRIKVGFTGNAAIQLKITISSIQLELQGIASRIYKRHPKIPAFRFKAQLRLAEMVKGNRF